MLFHNMNGYRPRRVNGLDDWLEFVGDDEVICGVDAGMQVIVRVDAWPGTVWSEVTGRKFRWQDEQMFVYCTRQFGIV